ncbi:MAG: TIGR03067 domain-containing protein [Acidobacteria bacterium]|nr:TIGR03067 domain-containing protein [Acidobacteriota bacterium]
MKEDLERLQGVWNIVSLEMEGQAVAAGMLTGARIEIQGARFTSTGMGGEYEGTIEIEASKNPRTFNLNFTKGPEKGNTSLGIYQLEEDTWRICLTTRGADRPKKFASEPGAGHALEVLKRASAAGQSAATGAAAPEFDLDKLHFEPAAELEGEWSMVSGVLDGQPLDKRFAATGRRVVEGNELTVLFGPQVYSKAKFTVDRSKTPRAIDYYNTQGGNAGKTQYGIYELIGKTLQLCLAAPGQERPEDFTSAPGSARTLTVWTLVKKGTPAK